MAETQCRHFNGYKPCPRFDVCHRARCPEFESIGPRVLLIHLEALGAVLRSTALIAGVRRAFPGCAITWVTRAPALLENLGIERVLGLGEMDLLSLGALSFDLALVIDKSLAASGVLARTRAGEVRGFRADQFSGAIVPANREAQELWALGLSNPQKFFVNQKSEQQLVHEALNLGPYLRDPYRVVLTPQEHDLARHRRAQWGRGLRPIVGINTGASPTLNAKKLTVGGQRELIKRILADSRLGGAQIVLLGGREDTERNQEIARGLPVIASPTTLGLRDGLASVAAVDLVFSGDSLGMHMAIGLNKWTVAWFGPTCPQEIDLYDRGVKILSGVGCAPCWKRDCRRPQMCYDQLDLTAAVNGLAEGMNWPTSSSKPHTPETFTSASPS